MDHLNIRIFIAVKQASFPGKQKEATGKRSGKFFDRDHQIFGKIFGKTRKSAESLRIVLDKMYEP